MNPAINELAISVFKKPLAECSLTELKQLTQQYPWFGPAQLLYTSKLQSGNPSIYEEQVQKTSLYFQNRVWLHHLLNDNNTSGMGTDIQTSETSPENKMPLQPVEQNEIPSMPEPVLNNTAADEATTDTGIVPEPTAQDITSTKDEPAMMIPSLKIERIDPAKAPLTFEPYHTVDYFASQGIKFKEEEKPQDKLGQQLKSFTEWLKVLKKIPASEIEKITPTDSTTEKKVEQMAEYSLAERHVITEAMAEVWIKQGNRAKAEEIYRKLSLLDPLKTAYFAAKIEEIKKTS